MLTSETSVSLDRPQGVFSVDSNGLANYRLNIDLPPGIGDGNTPDLALCYSQGKGNGVTGIGWLLSGSSSIQRAPRNLAIDGVNAPITYNPDGTRFALDGTPLIVSSGTYGEPGAAYTTEIFLGKTITTTGQSLQQGFLVTDYDGRTMEYGTSDDSRSFSIDGKNIREWHLKYNYDFYGNCMTYNYTKTPKLLNGQPSTGDLGITYLDTIIYSSNKRDNGQAVANRVVSFFYNSRNDPVVVCGAGDVLVMVHRLCRIQTNVQVGSNSFQARAYNLSYDTSLVSGASRIVSIIEEGADGSTLSPTTIEYSSSGDASTWFQPAVNAVDLIGMQATNIESVTPMKITGKGLSDLCLFAADQNQNLSIRSYLAQVSDVDANGNSMVSWAPSTSDDGLRSLPPIANGSKPVLLTTDLSGDGRNDFVMAFDSGSGLKLSLSRCTGQGFAQYTIYDTPYDWQDDDHFFAIDCDGNGREDIIQITTLAGEITIRSYFSSTTPNGDYTIGNITEFSTGDIASNTLRWFPADVNGDGLQDLVRVWYEEEDNGLCSVYITAYLLIAQPSGMSFFAKGPTNQLGTYTPAAVRRLTVLACDINADGIEDIVFCELEQYSGSDTQLTFNFSVFLCDGAGDFSLYSSQVLNYTIHGQTTPVTDGSFDVMGLDGTGLPSLVYRFQDYLGNQIALVAEGNYSAQISGFDSSQIFSQTTRTTVNQASLVSADINGSGKSSWFAWSSDGGPLVSMIPIYNVQPLGDMLSSITDPLGLCTIPSYRPLSQPSVYNPGMVNLSRAVLLDPSLPTIPILGGDQYVVSQYTRNNVEDQNALQVSQLIFKFYEHARTDIEGRGWQGFQTVYTLIDQSQTLVVETYSQDYPLTMYKIQEDTYSFPSNSEPVGAAFPVLDPKQQLRSNITGFSIQEQSVEGSTTYFTNKVLEQINMYDSGVLSVISGTTTSYDDNGLPTLTTMFVGDPANPTTQIFQQGTSTVYTSGGLRQNLVSVQKTSTVQANLDDMTQFLSGDISWSNLTYDKVTYGLQQRQDWSAYHNCNISYAFESDIYGNQLSSTSPTGLVETTTYDSAFHTFPIQVSQSGSGLAQALVRSYAFDARFGLKMANTKYNGLVTCSILDNFGRESSSMISKASSSQNQTPDLVMPFVIGPSELLNQLDPQSMTTISQTVYSTIGDIPSNRTWIFKSVTSFMDDNSPNSATVSTDYVDSNGRSQQSVSQQGSFPALWTYRSFNSIGGVVSKSVPINEDGRSILQCLEYSVPTDQCQTTSYDELQRPVIQVGPRSNLEGNQLTTTTSFKNGGTNVTTVQSMSGTGKSVTDNPTLSSTESVYQIIAGQAQVCSIIDELGKITTFGYDAAGNMTLATDPGGKQDTSNYDLQGLLRSTNNEYQNPSQKSTGAMTYSYDTGNRPTTETNASGEITTYEYDALNRRTRRKGADGRTIIYTYDGTQSGMGNITSVTVSKPNVSDVESAYDFVYNERGLPVSNSLTLNINETKTYTTQYTYDLQGQMLSKVFPDGSIMEVSYSGTQAASSTIVSDNSQSPIWKLVADYTAYDVYGKCSAWNLTGSGSISGDFSGTAQFDVNGSPVLRKLDAGSINGTSLVHETYNTDGFGRIVQYEELVSQNTINYTYLGKRLASSSSNNISADFSYDQSGNLLGKGGLEFAYENGKVSGTKNSEEVFSVNYDTSGRMISRAYNSQSFSFQYDSFGKTSQITNQQSGQASIFYSDFLGRNLAQVMPDGSTKVQVSPGYTITTQSDGTEVTDRYFYGPDSVLAKITSTKNSQQTSNILSVFFTNHKGNVSHIFNASGQLQQQLTYDDFGMLTSLSNVQADLTVTYESQYTSLETGLMSFGARQYDPVLGRFTTPDNQWSSDPLTNCDITNRYAFENNDPINHIDPTGHWTGWAIAALIVGIVVTVTAVVAVSVITFGIAAPGLSAGAVAAAGTIGSAFAGAGTAAISYSALNQDQNADSFAKGIASEIAVGFALGLLTGGVGSSVLLPARISTFAVKTALIRSIDPVVKWAMAGLFGIVAGAGARGIMMGASFGIQHYGTSPAISRAFDSPFVSNSSGSSGANSSSSSNSSNGSISSVVGPQASGVHHTAANPHRIANSYGPQPRGPAREDTSTSRAFDWMDNAADALNITSATLQIEDIPSATMDNVL